MTMVTAVKQAQVKHSTNWGSSLVELLRQHPLEGYFLIALGFSWVCELIAFGIFHLPELSIGRAFILGPTLAAFIVTAVTEGRPGLRRLLRRYVLWRVRIPWYLFVLLGVPALVLLGFFVMPGGVAAFRVPAPTFVLSYLEFSILIFFAVSFFEEPGWRGFALPRLQQRSGPVGGTIILGLLWSLWHLPLFLFVPQSYGVGADLLGIMWGFATFSIGMAALAVIITWVFNNARGSILLAITIHTTYDAAVDTTTFSKLFPSLSATPLINLLANANIVLIVVALLVIVVTRSRLGYDNYLCQTALPTPGSGVEQVPATAPAS